MGRHNAPEPDVTRASVVLMDTARTSRARLAAAAESSKVDFSVAEAVVDDLTLITADDQFLDRIAAGQGDVFAVDDVHTRRGPGGLAPLLATWRADIVAPQWPDAPTVEEAINAAAPRVRPARRALRPILGVAVAISALLFGSAAIGAQHAQPGDALWPLTQVLYSDHATSVQAGLAVKASLGVAKDALDHDQPRSALNVLTSASGEVDKVLTTDGKDALRVEVNQLMVQAKGSLQAAATGGVPSPARTQEHKTPVAVIPITPEAVVGTPIPETNGSTRRPSKVASTASTRPSTVGATTAPPPTTGASSPSIAPPPVVVSGTTTAAPVPSGTSHSSASSTSNPVTTSASSSTDPGTPTSSVQPTTNASTTSELPTPTQTTAPQTTVGVGAAAQGLSADGVTSAVQ